MASVVAVADSTTGTVQITVNYPAPVGTLVHVIRVHPDGSEYPVLGSPVEMSNGWAVLYDNAAPMDVPIFYYAFTDEGFVAFDDFNRVNVDTWNTASSGQVWVNTNGAASDYDVDGTRGTQLATNAGVLRFSTMDVGATDVTVQGDVSISSGAITGADATARVWGRFTDIANHYEATVAFTTTDTAILAITKRVAGVATTLAGPITIQSSVPGVVPTDVYRIKLMIDESTIQVKAWRYLVETEPLTWQLNATDIDLTTGTLAGIGNRREVGNTNANLLFSWDNFAVSTPIASPPNETARYSFPTDDEGWVGEGATTVAWVATPSHEPPGSLRATKTMSAGTDSLRFNDNDQLPNNLLPWGNTFTAWVLVPEDAAGTGWVAHLELQDSAFAWHAGQDVPVTPGVWTPIAYIGTYAVLIDARSIGVQVSATGVNGSQSVYLDTVVQTFDAVSDTVEVDASPDGWLKNPVMPTVDVRIDNCEVHTPDCLNADQLIFFKALDAEDNASASGVFDIVNRAHPMVVAQTRKGIRSTLVLVSRRLEDITALRTLLSTGTPLILELPTIYGWGIETFGQDWVQFGDVTMSRLGIDMRKPYRTWSMPLVVLDPDVAYPSGGTGGNGIGVAGATWGDLAIAGQTWGDHAALGQTWLDTAQGEGF
jgi:hypothetical protein